MTRPRRWARSPKTDRLDSLSAAFRLDDSDRGLTVIEPGVLTTGAADEVEQLGGVSASAACTAARPELTLRITASDRTHLPQLLHQIQSDVVDHLAAAIEAPLSRLAVQLDVTRAQQTSDHVIL